MLLLASMENQKRDYKWWILGSIGCLTIACFAIFTVAGLTYFYVKSSPVTTAKNSINKADPKIQKAIRTAVMISTASEDFNKEPSDKELRYLTSKTKKASEAAIKDLNDAQKMLEKVEDLDISSEIKQKASLNSEATDSLERGFSQYIDWLAGAKKGYRFIDKIKEGYEKNESAMRIMFSAVKLANKVKDKDDNATEFKRVDKAIRKAMKMFSQAKNIALDAKSITGSDDAKTLVDSINLGTKAAQQVKKLASGDYKDTNKYNKIAAQYNVLRKRSLALHNNILAVNNPTKWVSRNILTKTGALHKSFIEASKARKQASAISID